MHLYYFITSIKNTKFHEEGLVQVSSQEILDLKKTLAIRLQQQHKLLKPM